VDVIPLRVCHPKKKPAGFPGAQGYVHDTGEPTPCESANGDRLQGNWHAVRGSESSAAVMESSPALPFPPSREKSVDKVGGGVYNVSR